MAESLDLHVILHALEVGDGRAEIDLLAWQGVGEGVADAVRIDEHHLVLAHTLQIVDDVVIFANPHATGFEVLCHLVGDLVLVDEQLLIVSRDIGIGNGHGCKGHVVAAQVEQPGDVV